MSIDAIARDYESATNEFLVAVKSITPEQFDRRVEGGWTPRQVIHHVADSEAQSYARLRRLLAEPAGVEIQGYDEGLWARSPLLGYEELPVEHSLSLRPFARPHSTSFVEWTRATSSAREPTASPVPTACRPGSTPTCATRAITRPNFSKRRTRASSAEPSARSRELRRPRRAGAGERSSCTGRAVLGSARASPTCAESRRAP